MSITSDNEVTTGSEDLTSESNNKSGVRKLSKVHVEFKEDPEEVPVEIPTVEKEVKEVVNKVRIEVCMLLNQ